MHPLVLPSLTNCGGMLQFTQLQFDKQGLLKGARSRTYLLEKSRILSVSLAGFLLTALVLTFVLQVAARERNYHIFYQVLSLAPTEPDLLLEIGDGSEENGLGYPYMGSSEFQSIEGKTDAEHMVLTVDALNTIGVDAELQKGMFHTIAAVLHFGCVIPRARTPTWFMHKMD